MRNLLVALYLVSTPALAAAPPAGGPTGIGLGGGFLSNGISAKHHLSDRMALQGLVGAWGVNGLAIQADVLLQQPDLYTSPEINVAWNFGAGGGLGLSNGPAALMVSGIAGVELQIVEFPLEFVLEYRPTFGTYGNRNVPGVGTSGFAFWTFGAHVRWYFGGSFAGGRGRGGGGGPS